MFWSLLQRQPGQYLARLSVTGGAPHAAARSNDCLDEGWAWVYAPIGACSDSAARSPHLRNTTESFARWKETRAKRKAEETETRRVEEAKKTGTKGYSALSGRALFSFDPSLFRDDEAADETLEYDAEDDAAEDGAEGAEAGGEAEGEGGAGGAPLDEALYLEGGDDDDLDAIGDDDEGGGAEGGGGAGAAAGEEADERSA